MTNFEKENYTIEESMVEGEKIQFLAYRNLVYVDHPVSEEFQRINLFVPLAYQKGESIHGYTKESAPIFMPNTVGGYMPGPLDEPGYQRFGPRKANSIFRALQHGYVVAAPALRGRTLQNSEGDYIGKAPACVVDYKAAVRYLRHFSKDIPGDVEKIITNGTSAGGALSALMGATGNALDYVPYLEELGAAPERDDIFAASCYCPITNLDHADMAYEWQFSGVTDYHRMNMEMGEGGRPNFIPIDGEMTEEQIRLSEELGRKFPEYLNSLSLKDEKGNTLTLDAQGKGSFLDYIKKRVLESAQKVLDQGEDLSEKGWLTVQNGQAVEMDFPAYVREITRMKTAPAFDDVTMDSPENDLFGSRTENCRHFTEFSRKHSHNKCVGTGAEGKEEGRREESKCAGKKQQIERPEGQMADAAVIALMNPMGFLQEKNSDVAKHWRIRHGECDRDTSLAISAILMLTLQSMGCEVDYHLPWNTPHSGDYDLEELFAWIDQLCQA